MTLFLKLFGIFVLDKIFIEEVDVRNERLWNVMECFWDKKPFHILKNLKLLRSIDLMIEGSRDYTYCLVDPLKILS